MSTWFDTINRSFDSVPIDAANDQGISTTEFLEAAESLTTLFGISTPRPTALENPNTNNVDVLGSVAFNPVKNDLLGNIKVRLPRDPSFNYLKV